MCHHGDGPDRVGDRVDDGNGGDCNVDDEDGECDDGGDDEDDEECYCDDEGADGDGDGLGRFGKLHQR